MPIPLPSLHPFDLLVGDACGALLWFIVYQKSKNARKYRRGAEYGTARWGNAKDIEPFIDPDFSQNILLSETERLTLGKIADPEKEKRQSECVGHWWEWFGKDPLPHQAQSSPDERIVCLLRSKGYGYRGSRAGTGAWRVQNQGFKYH